MKPIIECVPNISEGRDAEKISQITSVVERIPGVRLLDVDPGVSTNRTVITFVGEPEVVCEAAFQLIKKASELIDMRLHKGAHPRMGATDVCPLIPIANISMEETAAFAKKLGARVGKELGIPGYFYENAASYPERKNLAHCRSGEYEGLDKLSQPEWKPDFGPTEFNENVKKTGATAISARDFLVAYNVNLNTTSTRRANAIAFDIREAGRVKREGNPVTGKIINDKNGDPIRIPGSLKSVKGIGWFIEEYGIAQLSLNLTNLNDTPVHVAFDEACEKARERGVRVTGSELVGLIPKKAILDAADYFLKKQERSLGISEKEKIKIAVKSLGLDDLSPFNPEEKIIEYMIEEKDVKKLVNMSLTDFADETSSESPAPGGGSISAYCGVLGIALGTMVANLSAHKRGWDNKWEEFSEWAEKGRDFQQKLMHLVDEDTAAFNKIMEAVRMAKGTDEEKKERNKAMQEATKYAIEVPFEVMKTCFESMEVLYNMSEKGNPNSISDAGVGALCARTGVIGAFMNVKINCKDCEDTEFVAKVISKGEIILEETMKMEQKIVDMVEKAIMPEKV